MNTKRIITLSLLVVTAVVLIALAVLGVKNIPGLLNNRQASAPDYWPTEGWRTSTPEEQGIDSDKLADMLLAIRDQNVQIHSLRIIRNGYVVLDATFYPYNGKDVHDVASDTKSVMTTLIGIAADQGKLGLDNKMVSFFPDRNISNLDAQKQEITVRHLVSMSSGLDCSPEADERTLKEMVSSPDYVQFVLDRKISWAPGEHFVYCSPAIHMLSPILQQATGIPSLDFARQYLFEPLGIRDAMWEQDPQGYYDGWGDLSLLPQDMAKIGFLFLHQGQWDGKQIISSQWVEQATKAHMYTGDDPYGYGWWIDPAVEGAFRADGRGGQFIFVLPKWNMVVVTTGGGFGMDEIAEMLLASFVDFENPLAANPAGVARLEQAVAAAILPPASTAVTPLPVIATMISGIEYVFQPNPATLQSISFKFDGSSEAAAYYKAEGRPQLPFVIGLDGVYRFSPGPDGRPAVYRGAWIDPQTFFLEYDGITNNDHSMFKFHFEGELVNVSVQETAHEVGVQLVGHSQEP